MGVPSESLKETGGSVGSVARDPDDGRRDDLRHAADGTGAERGRKSNRSAGPGCHRGIAALHFRNTDIPSGNLLHSAGARLYTFAVPKSGRSFESLL